MFHVLYILFYTLFYTFYCYTLFYIRIMYIYILDAFNRLVFFVSSLFIHFKFKIKFEIIKFKVTREKIMQAI